MVDDCWKIDGWLSFFGTGMWAVRCCALLLAMERVWMLGVVGDGGIVVAMVSVGTFFGEGGMVDKNGGWLYVGKGAGF